MSKMRSIAYFKTITQAGEDVIEGVLKWNGKSKADLFHECQSQFGCCIGSATPENTEDKLWVFSRCYKEMKPARCAIHITQVFFEKEMPSAL